MKYLAIGLTFAVAACDATPTAPIQSTSVQPSPVVATHSATGMMALINAERVALGLAPVHESARLSRAAQAHAADMVTNGYFSHTGIDGSRFFERAETAGYRCARAENIAEGQQTDVAVMAAWMGSSGHRRNILLRDVQEFGIGRVNNTWVQMFGTGC